MRSREDNLSRFSEMLDRLGPGLWLHVDDVNIKALFQPADSVGIDDLTIRTAEEFAAERDCAFRYERKNECGVFGRAYSKSD